MKKIILLSIVFIGLLFYSTCLVNAQGVGINSSGSTADPSAILDASATNKGFLIPRLSTAQRSAISSPAEGLQIFNTTTKCFEAFVDGSWSVISCPAKCNPPTAPQVNAASNAASTSFSANWTAPSSATGYYLDAATDAGFTSFLPGYNNLNVGNVTTYTVTGTSCRSTYYYRVRAENSCGVSGNSGVISATVTLLSSFGTNGALTISSSTSPEQAYAIAIDGTAMYVAGYDGVLSGNYRWRIEKRDLNSGALITSFGTGGVVISDPSSNTDMVYAMAIYGTDLYVAGVDFFPNNYEWRIEKRDLSTGALITSFGAGGAVTSNPSSSSDYITSLAINASGLYIAGYDLAPGDYEGRIEKRDLSTGALITSFGTGGAISINPSGGTDLINALAVDATGLYVAGYDGVQGSAEWRIEKRDLTTGALITGFGSGGIITSNPTSSSDQIKALAIDGTALYAAGTDWTGSNYEERIEKRDLNTGALITSFGTGGVVTNNFFSDTYVYGAAIDGTGFYMTGYDRVPGNLEWRIEKWNLSTGAIIWSQTSNPTSNDDIPNSIALDATSVYIAGYDYLPGNQEWRIEKWCK